MAKVKKRGKNGIMAQKTHKRGLKANHLKLTSDLENAISKALKRKKPIGGWPKEDKQTPKSN